MASGAVRRRLRREQDSLMADVARLRALRAMAERDPEREPVRVDNRGVGKPTHFAKHGADAQSTHGRLGGELYPWMRTTDMPRARYSAWQ